MKKGITITAFFLGIVAVLLIGSVWVQGWIKNHQNVNILQRNAIGAELSKEPENTIDLLVLGDSESYTTISPLQLWNDAGVTAFDASQSGQQMSEMSNLFDTAMEKQEPKMVMIETNALYRTNGSKSGMEDYLVNKFGMAFPILQYHSVWKSAFKIPYAQDSTWKGFRMKGEISAYQGDANYMKATKKVREIPLENQLVMDEIISKCKDKGIQVVLYSGPSPVNYNMAKHNGLSAYAKDKDVTYIDFNMEEHNVGINWAKDTLDGGDHLNISGAQKVTAYVTNYLRDQGFEDHRNDQAYSAWHVQGAQYDQASADSIKAIRKS